MKTYLVSLKWDHLGRYPRSQEVRVKACNLSAAVGRALRDIKKGNPRSMREHNGATYRIDVWTTGNIGKEE